MNAAIGNAVSQGVAIGFGDQKGFNWMEVAASAAAAPIAQAVGSKVGSLVGQEVGNSLAAQEFSSFVGQVTSGEINNITVTTFSGGKINYGVAVADAFGNVVGDSLAQEIAGPPAATNATTSGNSGGSGNQNGQSGQGQGSDNQTSFNTFNAAGYTNTALKYLTLDNLNAPDAEGAAASIDTSYTMPNGARVYEISDEGAQNAGFTRTAAPAAPANTNSQTPDYAADNLRQLGSDLLSNAKTLGLGLLNGVENAAFQVVYQPLATTYDLEQVGWHLVTGDNSNIDYTSFLGQQAAGGASSAKLTAEVVFSPLIGAYQIGNSFGTAVLNGDPYATGQAVGGGAVLFGGAYLLGANNVDVSPSALGNSAFGTLVNMANIAAPAELRLAPFQSFELQSSLFAVDNLGAKYTFNTQTSNGNGFDFGYATQNADGSFNLFAADAKSGYANKVIPDSSFTSFGSKSLDQLELNQDRLVNGIENASGVPEADQQAILDLARNGNYSLQVFKTPSAQLSPDFDLNLQSLTNRSVAPTISVPRPWQSGLNYGSTLGLYPSIPTNQNANGSK